ncbi:MAG: choice-of-anchor B domain-containing protein [Planctomycetota bacterium]|jgi:choice-of-anchor B domain-containing protein
MHIRKTLLLATVLATSLSAQGVNCALLGTFNNHGPFNDVWGYTAPNGDEYALLASTTGTVVVDVTNPATPIERGFFPFGSSTWRDIRTYGTYAYVVTEATSGFQIIDLSNPNSPSVVGVFGTSVTSNAHNVCVDVGAGKLYLTGTNFGSPAWDLTTNPANPTFLGQASTTSFHDLHVENGYAYASYFGGGVLRIMDAAAPTGMPVLSNTPTPNTSTHNAWPNAAGTICVTTDETTGGVIKFFDITNKSNPIPLGQFTPNTSSIPHNAFIVGNKCHVSWYTEGYRCIDFSDPMNPVEVASYDTWPGSSGGFNGCWGCYPFLPSGNILASDRTTGLYIVRPSSAGFSKFGQGCVGSAIEPCPELNANGGTLSNQTNQYEYTFEVPATGSMQVTSFDIYTNSNVGSLTRAAHIYADTGSGPASTPIASTTITVGAAPGFYTATFGTPVAVNGKFFVGYDNSNDGVISNLNSGDTGIGHYRTPVSGNWAQSGLVQQPSWRVNCSGGGAVTPSLSNLGLPILNSSYDVTLSGALPSAFAVMVTGLSDTVHNGLPLPAPLPGAPGCSIFVAPDLTQLFITDVAGAASAPFSIPSTPGNIGLNLFHQWAVLDPINALGIVVSEAGKATIDT